MDSSGVIKSCGAKTKDNNCYLNSRQVLYTTFFKNFTTPEFSILPIKIVIF